MWITYRSHYLGYSPNLSEISYFQNEKWIIGSLKSCDSRVSVSDTGFCRIQDCSLFGSSSRVVVD